MQINPYLIAYASFDFLIHNALLFLKKNYTKLQTYYSLCLVSFPVWIMPNLKYISQVRSYGTIESLFSNSYQNSLLTLHVKSHLYCICFSHLFICTALPFRPKDVLTLWIKVSSYCWNFSHTNVDRAKIKHVSVR